jgi:hypothetical protein
MPGKKSGFVFGSSVLLITHRNAIQKENTDHGSGTIRSNESEDPAFAFCGR